MVRRSSSLEALIFDVDGTLADTERDGHRVAFNAAFHEFGLDWYWDEVLYGKLLSVTGGKERMMYYVENCLPGFKPACELEHLVVKLHQLKTRHYTRLLESGKIPLRTGVARLIQEARDAGLALAIATTTTPANVTALLTRTLGASSIGWFDVVAAGDVVPKKKPASDIYTYALDRLGLSSTACIAFEDSRNGILSSLGADVMTIVTVNDYTRDDDFSGAELVLDHLGEPDQPFQVLQGAGTPGYYVNIPMLRILHGAEHSRIT